ncbi:MAG: ATP synthase F1 subunit gamma [Actinobacteria bacterium]|nr:ATP synthase F1 subunit gamma [Actinomycetota bacterium]
MATLQDIRRRIASVHNTRKITKAMQMVAAAKLRRAQQRIESLRPYALSMIGMMQDLASHAEDRSGFPLLREHPVCGRVALLVFTGDRGLAGAFNASVIREAVAKDAEIQEQGRETLLMVVGKKGVGTFAFRGFKPEATWTGLSDAPTYNDAQHIARHIIDLYMGEQVDQVRLIYNQFRSPLEQTLQDVVRLPIQSEAYEPEELGRTGLYIYEPDAATIFERLLPAYVEIAVFRALLESSASEQGARMTAMQNASENAEEMIDTLTLELNRARQSAITQEILEVVAGANALG